MMIGGAVVARDYWSLFSFLPKAMIDVTMGKLKKWNDETELNNQFWMSTYP